MKEHAISPNLTVIESILLLANLRKLKLKPILTENAFSRLQDRMSRKFGIDIDGPPSRDAYELLSCRGGDLELWPSPREIARVGGGYDD